MLTISNVEVRVGANLLLDLTDLVLRVQAGDRVGLVGRNGAGKTSLMRIISGEITTAAGKVVTKGEFKYLPQDSKEGNTLLTVRERILSARNLDKITKKLSDLQKIMETTGVEEASLSEAINSYASYEERFESLGGYYAESAMATICKNLNLSDGILDKTLANLSGGQRRRIELARILFAAAPEFGKSTVTLLLDEPTNHLDADSIKWLREFLQNHEGGLVLISHNEELLEAVINKVWFLDPNRKIIDIYNTGWKEFLKTKNLEEERRQKEFLNASKKANALKTQALRFGSKASKATAARNWLKRADNLLSQVDSPTVAEKVTKIIFPTPAKCGKTPLVANNLTKYYGSLEVFSEVSFTVDKGSKIVILGFNGAGKTTLLKTLAGIEEPQSGEVVPGYGLRLGYFAQEHDSLQLTDTIWENVTRLSPQADEQNLRNILGSFMFSADRYTQVTGTLSGGEKTRLALAALVSSGANVLLLDEPTNNLDVQSRQKVLEALSAYEGAILLVTHDPEAARALRPERVIVLPDGYEDYWSKEYQELISLE